MQMVDVTSKYSAEIKAIQQAMQALAIQICENNPDWRELKGKLTVLNRLHQEELRGHIEDPFPNKKAEVTDDSMDQRDNQ